MNFDLTRSNLFATILYSLVLIAVFWGTGTMAAHTSIYVGVPSDELYVVSRQIDNFSQSAPMVMRFISAALVFVCSLLVARMAIRNVIFLERSYMPSMLYVIVSSTFYNSGESFLPLLVALFMIMGSSIIFLSYSVKGVASGRYLCAGFYFGLAAVIYPPALYFSPILIAGLTVFRVGNLKEWISTVVGYLLPLSLVFYCVWLLGGDVQIEFGRYISELNLHDNIGPSVKQFNIIDYTFIATTLTLIVLSYIVFLRSVKNYKLHSRLAYNFIFASMWWIVAVMLLSPVRSLYMLPIAAIGASVLIPAYFASRRPTFWSNFLYALLIMSAIALHLVRL